MTCNSQNCYAPNPIREKSKGDQKRPGDGQMEKRFRHAESVGESGERRRSTGSSGGFVIMTLCAQGPDED